MPQLYLKRPDGKWLYLRICVLKIGRERYRTRANSSFEPSGV